jgi:CheY-like chemotaxis protein
MNKCVLIVEDDPDILDILQFTLERPDLEIIAYNHLPTLQEVLVLLPKLIIMDVRIFGSEKTGDQLCMELKAYPETQHIPVILLSAEHRLAEISLQCKADGYIAKPFDIISVSKTVLDYLDPADHTSTAKISEGKIEA